MNLFPGNYDNLSSRGGDICSKFVNMNSKEQNEENQEMFSLLFIFNYDGSL